LVWVRQLHPERIEALYRIGERFHFVAKQTARPP
jgi:hypothetical protein